MPRAHAGARISILPLRKFSVNPLHILREVFAAVLPNVPEEQFLLQLPPDPALGDLAVPMFLPAKTLGTAPPALARELCAKIAGDSFIRGATAVGPYLNLQVDRSRLVRQVVQAVFAEGEHYGSSRDGVGLRALIEHTSINPNASPHVGRARNAMIGDSLARLLRFLGYDVEVHYYVNDIGRQIALLVLIADEIRDVRFEQILDAYVRANARAEADPDFAAEGYRLLAELEEGNADVRARFKAVTDLCLRGQLEVLSQLGITYDFFDHESDYLNDPRLEPVLHHLRTTGALFTDEEGRTVVDLAALGHTAEEGRYFVLRRANGSSMYGYRDLAYTIAKAERGAHLNFIVLGEDHKLYAQQLALILNAAGYSFPEAIYYSYILLKEGKMSTRQGKVVLLSDFLAQAGTLALERVEEQCPELSDEERKTVAHQVAVAAIRFGVLRVSPNKNVTFDMESSLSFQGDTGPYIQYCGARIQSILRKYGAKVPTECEDAFTTEEEAEWLVGFRLAQFPDVVANAFAQRSVAPIAVFVLDLAHAFTRFYHECPVLAAPHASQRLARLQLCSATLQVLRNALAILGIEIPQRM